MAELFTSPLSASSPSPSAPMSPAQRVGTFAASQIPAHQGKVCFCLFWTLVTSNDLFFLSCKGMADTVQSLPIRKKVLVLLRRLLISASLSLQQARLFGRLSCVHSDSDGMYQAQAGQSLSMTYTTSPAA